MSRCVQNFLKQSPHRSLPDSKNLGSINPLLVVVCNGKSLCREWSYSGVGHYAGGLCWLAVNTACMSQRDIEEPILYH